MKYLPVILTFSGLGLGFAFLPALSTAEENSGASCLDRLKTSPFAQVLKFDGDQVTVNPTATRFVKQEVGDDGERCVYRIQYRTSDKPGAPIHTGCLDVSAKDNLLGFSVTHSPMKEYIPSFACWKKQIADQAPKPAHIPTGESVPRRPAGSGSGN